MNSAWLGWAGIFIVLVALYGLAGNIQPGLRLLLAAGLALSIVAVSQWERNTAWRWPVILMGLGNASYSIYLIHNPLLSVTQRLAGRLGLPGGAALAFGVAAGVLAGWLYSRCVERPAMQAFRALLARRAPGGRVAIPDA